MPRATYHAPFLFWRGSGSGCWFHHRTALWQLSVMRTPVALPPIFEWMGQRMLERGLENALQNKQRS